MISTTSHTITISADECVDLLDELHVIYDRSNFDGKSGLKWLDWIAQFPVLQELYEAIQ